MIQEKKVIIINEYLYKFVEVDLNIQLWRQCLKFPHSSLWDSSSRRFSFRKVLQMLIVLIKMIKNRISCTLSEFLVRMYMAERIWFAASIDTELTKRRKNDICLMGKNICIFSTCTVNYLIYRN